MNIKTKTKTFFLILLIPVLALLTLGIFGILSLLLLFCAKLLAFKIFLWNQDYLISMLAALLTILTIILYFLLGVRK